MKEQILEILSDQFSQLYEKDLIDSIIEIGQIFHFKEGEIIMDYGGYIRMLPLVFKGAIKVTRVNEEGNEIFLYYLQPGDSCASSFTCCMIQKRSIIQTIAEEDGSFIGIPIKNSELWLSKYTSWRNFVFKVLDDRIMGLIDIVDLVSFSKMDDRLVDYLERKSAIIGNKIIKITHQEIATDLNASREAISRLLKSMENQGILSLGRNIIKLS